MVRECTTGELRAECSMIFSVTKEGSSLAVDESGNVLLLLKPPPQVPYRNAKKLASASLGFRYTRSDIVEFARHVLRELAPVPPEQLLDEIQRRIEEK